MADAEAPASKKRAREEEAVPAPYKGSDDEDDEEYNPMPAKWAKKDVTTAMLWYYRDRQGKRQGPFYPGQMRQWWSVGFFKPDQLVAPSFKGEVPRDFVRVEQFFVGEERLEAAFVAASGVALWPPAAQQAPPDWYEEDSGSRSRGDARRPAWLEDSVRRQRAGIHFKAEFGPTERENYN